MWCLIKRNESHSTVIQQKMEPPKILIPSLIDILFVLFIWNTQVSFPTVISQPTPFLILSYALSLTLLVHFSLSLLLSPTYSPFHSYLPQFFIKAYWFGLLVLLNKCISTNIELHLGFAHNKCNKLMTWILTKPMLIGFKVVCFLGWCYNTRIACTWAQGNQGMWQM